MAVKMTTVQNRSMVEVGISKQGAAKKVPVRRLKKAARRILGLLHQDGVELSLALVGDEEIRKLNARYRNKNGPTDVLSFPSKEHLPPGEKILGDVVISVEQANRQAKKRGKALDEEMETLLIHGILHILGYDHERSKKEATIMWGLEKKIHRALCEERGGGV